MLHGCALGTEPRRENSSQPMGDYIVTRHARKTWPKPQAGQHCSHDTHQEDMAKTSGRSTLLS